VVVVEQAGVLVMQVLGDHQFLVVEVQEQLHQITVVTEAHTVVVAEVLMELVLELLLVVLEQMVL